MITESQKIPTSLFDSCHLSPKRKLINTGRFAKMLVQNAERITTNWDAAFACNGKTRGKENWRWTLRENISGANKSAEVILERAIARACIQSGRSSWANQIPMASGVLPNTKKDRGNIDLAHRVNENTYELIELKVASNDPAYAAFQIFKYGVVWLLSRRDKAKHQYWSPLLDAKNICLSVVAPADFYDGFELQNLQQDVNDALTQIECYGAKLEFAFYSFPSSHLRTYYSNDEALKIVDERKKLF